MAWMRANAALSFWDESQVVMKKNYSHSLNIMFVRELNPCGNQELPAQQAFTFRSKQANGEANRFQLPHAGASVQLSGSYAGCCDLTSFLKGYRETMLKEFK